MTATQRQQLTRAEAIAIRDELHAIKGTTKSGQVIYGVLNRTETKRTGTPTYHLLKVDGLRISCDCPAGLLGRVCAHRAAVRALIIQERDQRAVEQSERRESSPIARPVHSGSLLFK